MNKWFLPAALLTSALLLLSGCAFGGGGFDIGKDISVVSREDGSGTRGAFVELFGIQESFADGTRKDRTTKEALVADKTDIIIGNVTNDPHAVGYISVGSLGGTVKALDIGGVAASAENVKNGTYAARRPFIIAVKGEASGLAKDFIDFILSREGQEVVAANRYISVSDTAPAYSGDKPPGRIVIVGSSSVTPVMEKLKEAYQDINPSADIEVQMSDSTSGMTAAMGGTCDIGMASRELKNSERAELRDIVIALDGIAVIVNNSNPVNNLTAEQVKDIFTGEITKWSDVQ